MTPYAYVCMAVILGTILLAAVACARCKRKVGQ